MPLQERYAAILEKCVGSLSTWQNFIRDNLEGRDKDIQTAKLEEIAKEYCIIDSGHQISEKAISSVEEGIKDASKTYNVDEMYREMVSQEEVDDPVEHEIWQQLFYNNVSIQEVRPAKKKNNTSAQYEEVDDSLMCCNSFSAPLDPISKVVIRNPVRNKKCRHIYDSYSIHEYITQSRNKARCPYIGCSNNRLVTGDLQADAQLEEQIVKYLETQQSQEECDEESD